MEGRLNAVHSRCGSGLSIRGNIVAILLGTCLNDTLIQSRATAASVVVTAVVASIIASVIASVTAAKLSSLKSTREGMPSNDSGF